MSKLLLLRIQQQLARETQQADNENELAPVAAAAVAASRVAGDLTSAAEAVAEACRANKAHISAQEAANEAMNQQDDK